MEDKEYGFVFPAFTALMILWHWCSFMYGVLKDTSLSISDLNIASFSPISPPNTALWFRSVGDWPECNDERHLVIHFITHQFVHSGLAHIITNHIFLLIVGMLFESRMGFLKTGIVYWYGIVISVLGHNIIWPFKPLIGCSHGQ
jgi:membrane associated rhomboid family serine protease